jgi:hypothetical protein
MAAHAAHSSWLRFDMRVVAVHFLLQTLLSSLLQPAACCSVDQHTLHQYLMLLPITNSAYLGADGGLRVALGQEVVVLVLAPAEHGSHKLSGRWQGAHAMLQMAAWHQPICSAHAHPINTHAERAHLTAIWTPRNPCSLDNAG